MSNSPRTSPTSIRLPADLMDRVKAAAEAERRSINQTIVMALEKVFPPPAPKTRAKAKKPAK